MDLHTIYTIAHLLGVAVGAGGAYMSDVMFMSSVKDNRINHTEYKFMQTGSLFVWIGIGLLVISGLLLFSLNPSFYLESDKFISKMSIVLILIANGIFFHRWHMPVIKAHKDQEFNQLKRFRKARRWLVYSGAISIISWTFALVLGAWRTIPYNVLEIMSAYVLVLFSGLIIGRLYFHHKFKL